MNPAGHDNVSLNKNMSDTVLEIKALTRRFGMFTAVDSLTRSVNAGEVFGLLSSNGAGKTTTLLSDAIGQEVIDVVAFLHALWAAFLPRRFSTYDSVSPTSGSQPGTQSHHGDAGSRGNGAASAW